MQERSNCSNGKLWKSSFSTGTKWRPEVMCQKSPYLFQDNLKIYVRIFIWKEIKIKIKWIDSKGALWSYAWHPFRVTHSVQWLRQVRESTSSLPFFYDAQCLGLLAEQVRENCVPLLEENIVACSTWYIVKLHDAAVGLEWSLHNFQHPQQLQLLLDRSEQGRVGSFI
jgi:hypothetical protein